MDLVLVVNILALPCEFRISLRGSVDGVVVMLKAYR